MNVLKLTKQVLVMLCVAILFCSGCKKDEPRVYELLPPDPEDVTSMGILSVNIENTGGATAGEGSTKAVDNSVETKFLIFSYAPNLFMQLQFRNEQHITSYSLTSANDAPNRDPKNWTLAASKDGTTWETVDTRTNETFATRKLTKTYEFTNNSSYKYYRLNISAIGSGTLFQLAEWRVVNVPVL
jgi:hypothetical protein